MKAGILTFHSANNYGAVLQAYALTQWLNQRGIEAEVINYQSKVYEKYELFRSAQYRKAPYLFGVDLMKYPGKKKRNRAFDSFRSLYLPISDRIYRKESDFDGITDQYDFFICGSDQIWNPELTKGLDPVFFLNFVTDPHKKIAYAPSIALSHMTEFQVAEITKYISSFAALSIREQEGIDLVQPYCDQDIAKCCDPVFLLDKTSYDKICSDRFTGKKFVFLYVVGRAATFQKVISFAEKTAKKKGLQLYYLIDGDKTLYHIDGKNVFGCDPCDFLSLIRNAEYVISNSFHATAFSVLYAKQFMTFLKDGTGSRMANLLKTLNLEDRIYQEQDAEASLDRRIDYSGLEAALWSFRDTSLVYLEGALGIRQVPVQQPDQDLLRSRRRNREELLNFVEWRRHAYLARHKNMEIVAESRSGGVFTVLSDAILSSGGIVYGCKMEGPGTAIHCRATTREERDLFRGSKYIQSEMRDCFKQVRADLKNGKLVLFSGTGCQVAGLYNFLAGTDTSGLYTVDIICHGTPSPRLWKEYLTWMQGKYRKEISEVAFRDKRYGWKAHLETVRMGDTSHTTSTYRVLFLKNAFLRPSCYACPFASLRRRSDITIGDAWGVEGTRSPLNDNKGCSIVLVNSEKGRTLFEQGKSELLVENVDLEQYLQHNLYAPSPRPADRCKYWDCLDKKGFDELARRYGVPGPFRWVKDRKLILSCRRR